MYTFRKAVRTNTSTLIALAGPSGSGKTYSALRLARGLVGEHGKMVLIDTEAGRSLHYSDAFAFDHLDLKPPFSPENYAKAIAAAEEAGYQSIIIDSMSHEWAGDGGCQDMHDAAHEKLGNTDATNILAWRDAKLDHKRMMSRLLQMRSHLIFLLRAEEKIKFDKDPKTGKTVIVPQGWMPICEKNMMYEMTVSFMLNDQKPGYGQAIKLQAQHRPFFDATKPIDEQAGAKLAEWASGGTKRQEDGAGEVLEAPQKAQKASDAPAPPLSHADADREIAAADAEQEYRAKLNSIHGTNMEVNALWKEITNDRRMDNAARIRLYPRYKEAIKNART